MPGFDDGVELDDFESPVEGDESQPTAPDPNTPAAPAAPAQPADEIAQMRSQLRSFERELGRVTEENRQLQNSERMLTERLEAVRNGRSQPAPASDKPEDFLDEIAVEGVGALKKHGYVHESQMEQRIREEIDARLGAERTTRQVADYTREIPELNDPESDFSRSTKAHYERYIQRNPQAAGTPAAWIEAVETAKIERQARGNGNQAPPDNRNGREAERTARIARQGTEGIGGGQEPAKPRVSEQGSEVARRLGVGLDRYAKVKSQMGGRR